MRAGQPTARIQAELANLARVVGAVSTVRIRADIDAHEQGLSSCGLVFFQMIRMFQALQAERWNEVNALRGEYERLRLMATGSSEHGRSAVTSDRRGPPPASTGPASASSNWQEPLAVCSGPARHDDRVSGRAPRVPWAPTPAPRAGGARGGGKAYYFGPGAAPTTTGRRVGAGLLAALEVIRIRLEFASTMAESHRIMEAEEARNRAEGVRTVFWWLRQV